MRIWLKEGKFDDRMVELEVTEARSGPMIEIFPPPAWRIWD